MIKENTAYVVKNEEEAKFIVNKMYEEGYRFYTGNKRDVIYTKNTTHYAIAVMGDIVIGNSMSLISYKNKIEVKELI